MVSEVKEKAKTDMKIFSKLYGWTMSLARHPRAPWFLGGLSFAESSFFPIPPDVMLAPMCLGRPQKAWVFALITTVTSVLGGMFGFLIGQFAFDAIQPYLQDSRYWSSYLMAVDWFNHYGFWAIFLAGFSPIPYKIFTITAGAMSMLFAPFVLASIIGRGARFFLVAGVMRAGGPKMEAALGQYMDRLGWGIVCFVCLGLLLWQM